MMVRGSCIAAAWVVVLPNHGHAESVQELALEKIRKHIRPITHPLGDRLPIVTWQGPDFPAGLQEGSIEEDQRIFLDRGFMPTGNRCGNVERAKGYLPIFKSWQKRGFPVCFLPQGWLQTVFFAAKADRPRCAHQPPAEQSDEYPCPSLMMVSKRIPGAVKNTTETLRFLKDNGIDVRFLMVDFESGAYLRNTGDREERVKAQADMALRCPRCVEMFGKDALSSCEGYVKVVNRARAHATKAILCGPARTVFPHMFIGNFYAWPISRVPRPDGRWPAYGYERSGLNVAMPRVYINAGWHRAHRDTDKMNWNALHGCLADFSPAASVRREGELLIPWSHIWLGGKYLKFPMQGRKLPEPWVMSEMARHMMLRGAETFAIWMDTQVGEYPPDYPYPEYAEWGQFVYDVKGVQEGFNDMLQFNAFLRRAKPMTFEAPGQLAELGPQTATWSGMQTPEKALVRTISFNHGKPVIRSIQVYGKPVQLTFGPRGKSHWIYPDGRVEPLDGDKQGRAGGHGMEGDTDADETPQHPVDGR